MIDPIIPVSSKRHGLDRTGAVLTRVRGAAAEVLWRAATDLPGHTSNRQRARRALSLLDCVLRLTGDPGFASAVTLASRRFVALQHLFLGALYSDRFARYSAHTRYHLAKAFCATLAAAGMPGVPLSWPPLGTPPPEWIERFERWPLDAAAVAALRGTWLPDKNGGRTRVYLEAITARLGPAFAATLHAGLVDLTQARAQSTHVRDFAHTLDRFVAEHAAPLRAEDLQRPAFMDGFLRELQEFHFSKVDRMPGGPRDGSLASLQKLWGRYVRVIEALARRQLWALPLVLPAGNPSLITGGIRHRRTRGIGCRRAVYTQKLLTALPLQLGEDEAVAALLVQIRTHFAQVTRWARGRIEDLNARYRTGQTLERHACELGPAPPRRLFNPARTPNALPNALRAVRTLYGGYLDTTATPNVIYHAAGTGNSIPKHEVARCAGFPGQGECLAFAAFLMAAQPAITESALLRCHAFQADGIRIGVRETDAGTYLSLPKPRARRWQQVRLNAEATWAVQRLLELTAPLRADMRRRGLAGWQNLLLYSATPLGRPTGFPPGRGAGQWLQRSLRPYRDELGDLVETMTLSRIRATAGVLHYLETRSLRAMAAILGHTPETALRHYLPDPLWEWLAERRVRTFQNLVIQRAVGGTPHALAASDFREWGALDAFLCRHVLRAPPPAGRAHPPATNDLVVIGDLEAWTMLFALTAAVDQAHGPVRPGARWWAEFGHHLRAHVESPAYHQDGIKILLRDALARSQPDAFRRFVHA